MFDEQLRALKDFGDLKEDPETKILIILGDLDELPKGLLKFVEDGGAVLIASDRKPRSARAGELLQTLAGVSIHPHTLLCHEQESCYRQLQSFPFVVPIPGAQPALFADSQKVATNVPSCLVVERRERSIRPLATLPASCAFVTPDGLLGVPGRQLPLFAVAGEVGRGRVLVMADHSVFINEMMLRPDTGNFEFASSAVVWLHENHARTKVLFVEEGKIKTKFDIPLKSLNIPPEEVARILFEKRNEILVMANNALVGLEDRAAFDNGVMNLFDRAGFPASRLGRYAFVALTIALGLYALYRVGIRSGFRHDLTAPMLPIVLDRNLPVAALAEQRHLTLLARGNLTEPAMHLARQWFASLGVEGFDGPMPTLDAEGGWWQRRRLTGQLREAWKLAAGQKVWNLVSGQRGWITPRRLKAIERTLSELRAAHERGEWRLSAAIIEA